MTNDPRHNDDLILSELRALKEIVALQLKHTDGEVTELKNQYEKYGDRIKVIEIWQSNSMGKMAIVFTIIGILITALVSWVARHF